MALLRTSLANDLGEMKRIHAALIEFLSEEGVPPSDVQRVRLVAEELLVNIIRHAFQANTTHTITLTLQTGPRRVTVITEDDGKAFDPREAPAPPLGRPLEEQSHGGRGIYLIKQMSTSLDYARADGRNRVSAIVAYGT